MNKVHLADALSFLKGLPDSSVDMVYTDPPFGTGTVQQMNRKKGTEIVSKIGYSDKFDDYVEFLRPHLVEMHRALKVTGTMYLHMDWRWVHYAKVECDKIFGYDNFLNEVIWSYNFGGRGKDKWPAKHDTILVYVKERGKHTFNWEEIDRIPYVAPELQYVGRSKEDAEKRIAAGQVPTDVWSMSIVGTASKERLGYPNQKPLKLIERAIRASSNRGDTIVDPFVGSGTTAAAAHSLGRSFEVCDMNPESTNLVISRMENLGAKFKFTQIASPVLDTLKHE